MSDFKSLTLELYNHEIEVTFKPGTESFKKYGKSIKGMLMRRIWGEQTVSGQNISTVVGITLQVRSEEINISFLEILKMEKLTI